jgi:hypothetical protein
MESEKCNRCCTEFPAGDESVVEAFKRQHVDCEIRDCNKEQPTTRFEVKE